MKVEHIASNRHGREAAIVDEIVEIAITILGHVQLESLDQIERMPVGDARSGQRLFQGFGNRI